MTHTSLITTMSTVVERATGDDGITGGVYSTESFTQKWFSVYTVLVVGIVEFFIGIWAAMWLCMMQPCKCCYGNPS